jgi:hypothetical protein
MAEKPMSCQRAFLFLENAFWRNSFMNGFPPVFVHVPKWVGGGFSIFGKTLSS